MSFWEYLSENLGYVIIVIAVVVAVIIGWALKKPISALLFKNKKTEVANGQSDKDTKENTDTNDTDNRK